MGHRRRPQAASTACAAGWGRVFRLVALRAPGALGALGVAPGAAHQDRPSETAGGQGRGRVSPGAHYGRLRTNHFLRDPPDSSARLIPSSHKRDFTQRVYLPNSVILVLCPPLSVKVEFCENSASSGAERLTGSREQRRQPTATPHPPAALVAEALPSRPLRSGGRWEFDRVLRSPWGPTSDVAPHRQHRRRRDAHHITRTIWTDTRPPHVPSEARCPVSQMATECSRSPQRKAAHDHCPGKSHKSRLSPPGDQ